MNWFRKQKAENQSASDLASSILYNEKTFYKRFIQDLLNAKKEVIIESPYITLKRLSMFKPVFQRLINRGVQLFIITRDPQEHDEFMSEQSEIGIRYFESLGAQVLILEGGHHRKLAMIDRKTLWEGSLNILSQAYSREFMRKIESKKLTQDLFQFLQFDKLEYFRS